MAKARTRKLAKCPMCGGAAHMAEVTRTYDGKTFFAVTCNNGACRMSAVPWSQHCEQTEGEAIDAWNARKGGKR